MGYLDTQSSVAELERECDLVFKVQDVSAPVLLQRCSGPLQKNLPAVWRGWLNAFCARSSNQIRMLQGMKRQGVDGYMSQVVPRTGIS